MGFFTRAAHVNVHGSRTESLNSTDGRYDRQVRRNRKNERKKLKKVPLEAHTPEELCRYIEEKYIVEPLPKYDERFAAVYPGIKAHLAEDYADEALSSWDPDERFRQAQEIPESLLPIQLTVYCIPVTVNSIQLAWLQVYIESNHKYLAFDTVALENGDHYLVRQTIRDIVTYFGVTKEDQKEENERYIQFASLF